jgi:NAD(P)-dependent dehydrogenase (short-subunit alcohol dehydrogenase family)
MDLAGNVAIVTGAARGLGFLLVDELARIGMRVAGVDVRAEDLKAAMRRVADRWNATVLAIPADIGRESEVAAMVERTLEAFGRIDVLINNAGVRLGAPVWATETAAWDRIHDVNLKGHFLCTREVLNRAMLARGEGTLVFVSSLAGTRGTEGASAYSASKYGLIGFGHSVAKDLKRTRIRVTVIAPGRIDTPMARESEAWPLGLDWLDPAEAARLVVFCVQQDANTIIPELHIHHRAQL